MVKIVEMDEKITLSNTSHAVVYIKSERRCNHASVADSQASLSLFVFCMKTSGPLDNENQGR